MIGKIYLILLLIYFYNSIFQYYFYKSFEISNNELKNIIHNNDSLIEIKNIDIYVSTSAYIYYSYNVSTNNSLAIINLPNYEFIETELLPLFNEKKIPYYFRTNISHNSHFLQMIMLLLIILQGNKIGGGIFSLFRKKNDVVKLTDKKLLNDIYGMKEVKEQIEEFIDFFRNKDRLVEIGCRPTKGLLFVGPPGTGKTYFAKAIAGELNMRFISTSGSSFNEVFVGVGASRVREIFAEARENRPSIIFIDEIDAIGHVRKSEKYKEQGSDESDNTLNALLVEMDGFTNNDNIFIIGATNRGDLLDPALTRTGRFDRKIYFDLPELNDRRELFGGYLKKYKYRVDNLDNLLGKLAKLTTGCNCSDIENIVNEAGMICVKRNRLEIEEVDLMNAIDQVLIGRKRIMRILDEEKEIVAYHEAGHTILQYLLKYITNPVKVTIIPQGNAALGFTKSEANELKLMNYKQLIHELIVLYGGYLTEELIYGYDKVSTGASNDIEKATELIRAMIGRYGMTEKVGLINLDEEKVDMNYVIEIGKRIRHITKIILKKNMENIELIKRLLLEKETIYLRDLIEILGENQLKSKEIEIII
jgi:ATP-dependent metalloprotease FtsH